MWPCQDYAYIVCHPPEGLEAVRNLASLGPAHTFRCAFSGQPRRPKDLRQPNFHTFLRARSDYDAPTGSVK